jgi:large subunit ribosomal protein L6
MSLSRVSRPITLPKGVEVKIDAQQLSFKGAKGHSTLQLHPLVQVELVDGALKIQANDKAGYTRNGSGSKLKQSISGTMRAKINSMVIGVSQGFERKLILVGVGYKAAMKGKMLSLTLGFSHPVEYPVPEGLTIETPTATEILIKGIDRHLVGQTAATIRGVRAPEPYKGKGVRYSYEVINLKETKKK